MIIKGIIEDDFVNYKEASLYIAFPKCTFKCEKENGVSCCQNSSLVNSPDLEVENKELIDMYISNPITKAIVCGGLEPFDTFEELHSFISQLREYTDDTIVIYSGYHKEELLHKIDRLKNFKNIIIKFGRYRPEEEAHYDEVLGVKLVNNCQYAEKIS